jgi:hypothetical protein
MTWQASLNTAIRNLRSEEQELERNLTRVREAIRALGGLNRAGSKRAPAAGGTRRKLSPKGRAAIARAARKRWAKWRAQQAKG